jgi:hypothetical protein
MHQDAAFESLKATLDALENTTSWGILTLFATLTSTLFTTADISLSGITIPRNMAGIALFGILCGLNFKMLRLLQNVKTLLRLMEPNLDLAHMAIRLHAWVLNPFSETQGPFKWLSDNLGYALLLLAWWAGAQIGFILLEPNAQQPELLIVALSLFVVYLALGLMSMILIHDLIGLICKERLAVGIKMTLTFVAIPAGAIGLRFLMT